MAEFSEVLVDHYQSPRNRGEMPDADLSGTGSLGGSGPVVRVYLKAAERRVVRASFEAEGCGVTVAAASLLTELIIGRTLAECRTISAETLQDALGGLPPHKHYCAWVVVEALHQALPPDTYFAG